jgi:hypothetical protein
MYRLEYFFVKNIYLNKDSRPISFLSSLINCFENIDDFVINICQQVNNAVSNSLYLPL